jgi:hypothetical protein
MTVADLQSRRAELREDLAAGRRHVLADLRKPAPEIANLPIGDLLCWCEGLDEAAVTRILAAAAINWGRPTRLLTARDQAMLCFQIKAREPEAWTRWRNGLRGRQAA